MLRKCCGGCKHCPRWGTGNQLRVVGANHKSGTYLARDVMASIRMARLADACLLASHTVTSVHWGGLETCKGCGDVISRPVTVMAFVRDPFELIVSGYLYHKAVKEEWCGKPMRAFAKTSDTAKDFGLVTLLQSHDENKIPEENPSGDSYAKYLSRLDMRQGILAEFVRASFRDLPAMELALVSKNHSFMNGEHKHVHDYICLDTFTAPKINGQDPYVDAWTRVFQFLEFPEASIPKAVKVAQKHDIVKNPSALHGHGTAHGNDYRKSLFQSAVEVDQAYLGGRYGRLAEALGCPQPNRKSPEPEVTGAARVLEQMKESFASTWSSPSNGRGTDRRHKAVGGSPAYWGSQGPDG